MASPDPVEHLRELPTIRERCQLIFDRVAAGQGQHFDLDLSKMDDVALFVAKLIKRDFPDVAAIPPHGRWQHLDAGTPRLDALLERWTHDGIADRERLRRLIDLFVVSVLLDAGAGNQWKYAEPGSGAVFARSEGLAVASYHMFAAGLFANDAAGSPHQVDGRRLTQLTAAELAAGLQVADANPIADLDGRVQLLKRLGEALHSHAFFAPDARPGCIIDHLGLEANSSIAMPQFWHVIITGLATIWDASKRIVHDGHNLGDAWPSDSLPRTDTPLSNLVPFHKLSQWLTYSLMTPMRRVLAITFTQAEQLTGLPEYRNGGLFADLGVLRLRPAAADRGLAAYAEHVLREPAAGADGEKVPLFLYNDPVTVEWRALTVVLLDRLLARVNAQLGETLSLAQMLEAGSWKGGREMAAVVRPKGRGPPIMIVGDGTLF